MILTDRNKVALKVLARELAAGKKKLAIFYGAAHLPDLEERMVEKMGFERKATRWVTAWKLPERVELKNQIRQSGLNHFCRQSVENFFRIKKSRFRWRLHESS